MMMIRSGRRRNQWRLSRTALVGDSVEWSIRKGKNYEEDEDGDNDKDEDEDDERGDGWW